MKILFVDDNNGILEQLLGSLSGSDHEFHVCSSTHEAINFLASNEDIEAVISSIVILGSSKPDYQPRRDIYESGLDLARWAKLYRPLMPVIGYSWHTLPDEYQYAPSFIFDDFLWFSDFEFGPSLFEAAIQRCIIARIARFDGLPEEYVANIISLGDFRLISEERGNIILPGSRQYKSWNEVSNRLNNTLLNRLTFDCNLLAQLDDRRFEELCATLLMRDGHRVHLTPKSDDGGFDLLAFKNDRYKTGFFLVECKDTIRAFRIIKWVSQYYVLSME